MISSLLLCSAVTLYSETTPYAVQLMPKGNCPYCCPVNEREDIAFLLYTKLNKEHPQRLFIDSPFELHTSFLNSNCSTVFYIHGFTELREAKSAKAIRKAFLENDDYYNLIVVDWSSLAAAPWYLSAVNNVKRVGNYFATFVKFLVKNGVPLESMHVVGFSLGAEVAGFAGKAFADKKLPRITGLDPAFPLYVYGNKKGHLTPTDAEFVDIIHTDGGILGFELPLGHVDFYPNGGRPFQPGCTYRELSERRNVKEFIACSHHRAWTYFAESVNNPKAFPATACSSYHMFKAGMCRATSQQEPQYMGMFVDKRLKGKYYLETNPDPPYGLGYADSIEEET